MAANMSNHLDEEILEAYLLGQLPAQLSGAGDDAGLNAIEDHLLICPVCIEAALHLESVIAAIRACLSQEAVEPRKARRLKTMSARQ